MNAVTGGSPFVSTPGIEQSSSSSPKDKTAVSPSPCKAAFIPCGSRQNRFLNRLVDDGVLGADYRLTASGAASFQLPVMDKAQLEVVRDFLNSEVSITIPFQTVPVTRSFKLSRLLSRLLQMPFVRCERVEIVGGLLRRILLCSPSFARDALEELGVKDPESLATEELLDGCSSNLPDADIRFRLASGEATICTNEIVSFIGELFGGLDSHWIRKLAFNKFHYINFDGTEFSIASFGKFLLEKLSSRPSELECLFAKSFKRENLFLHDGIKADIMPLLHAKEEDWVLRIEGTGRQALIDNLGKVIHIDNPKTVNSHGFLMLISYLSRGYIMGDDVVDDTSGARERVDVLYTLRRTFLTPFGQYQSIQEQLPSLVARCLQNHHPNDPSTPLIFLCNLLTQLEEHGSDQLLHSAWELISTQLLSQDWKESVPGLLALLAEALFEKKIPFSVVSSAVLLAGLPLLKSLSIDEKAPQVCLKKHRKKPFLQMRIEPAGDGHLLLPFMPETALKTLAYYCEGEDCTKDRATILKKLFAAILKKKNGPAPASSLLDASRPFFHESFIRLTNNPRTAGIDASSPLHFFALPVQLALSTDEKPLQQILIRLPEILFSATSRAERSFLFHHFLRGLAQSRYGSLAEELKGLGPYLQKKQGSGQFFGKWMEVLAKSEKREIVEASLVLWKTFKQKFPAKKRKALSLRLAVALLAASPQLAQRLAHEMQHGAEASLSGRQEAALLAQIMDRHQTQSPHEPDIPKTFKLLSHFLARKDARITKKFHQAAEGFLEKMIAFGHIRECAKLLEQLMDRHIMPPGSETLARLWTKLFAGESSVDRSYAYWEKANTLSIWKNQSKIPAYIPAVIQIAEKLLSTHCHASKGYLLLQHLAQGKIHEKQYCIRIGLLAKQHLDHLLRKSEGPSNDKASSLILKGYKKYLTPMESSAYLVQLLQRYVEDGETEKALLLWRQAVKFGSRETIPKLARATEGLLKSFLACPTGCAGAIKMLASPRFSDLLPEMTTEWIGIAARLLESTEGAHDERVIILRLALPQALKNSDPSLPVLASFLRKLLTSNPSDQRLLDLVCGQTEKILTALHASHQHLELCSYLAQLIEQENCPALEKTAAKHCLTATATLAGLPMVTQTALDYCETCLGFLHSHHPTEIEALSKCYSKLSGALYKHGKSKRGFAAAKALTLLDKRGRQQEACVKLCAQVQQRDLASCVDLLELFTSAYRNSKAFHGIIEALPGKLAKEKPLEQIKYFLRHRHLLLKGHTQGQLNQKITQLVERAIKTRSSEEKIRSCLLAFKEYQPTSPESCAQLLEATVALAKPSLMKMAWEVFEGILADEALFADATDQHIRCWRQVFELLYKLQSPEIHTLVKNALVPESSIGRPFGIFVAAEAKAENMLTLLRYALSLLKKEIGMTGSDLKNLIELFRMHFAEPKAAAAAAFDHELALFLLEDNCEEDTYLGDLHKSLMNLLELPEQVPAVDKLVDLYADRLSANPNTENLTHMQRVLGHKSLHTSPRRSSMLWWRMLSMNIKVLDSQELGQITLPPLISSYEKIKDHPGCLDSWANEILDRIISFLDENHTAIVFNQQFLSFFRKIVENPDCLEMTHDVIGESIPISSILLKGEAAASEETSRRFFRYMNLLIRKLLKTPPKCHHQYLIKNHFISTNLAKLIKRFPTHKKALANTVRHFTFWITPEQFNLFQLHVLYAGEIFALGVQADIFSSSPRHFIEGLMLLDAKTTLPSTVKFSNQMQILYDLSHRLLSLESPYGALRVVQILRGVQGIIVKPPYDQVQKIYERLIDLIVVHPTFALDGTYYFEFVRSALMQSDTFLFLDGSREGFETVRNLCSRLFRTVLRVIIEKKFNGDEKALAGWLIRFLRFAVQYGAYVGLEPNKEYFDMVQTVLPYAVKYLDAVDECHRNDFIESTYVAITGVEDSETDICRHTQSKARKEYSKNLKIKRAGMLAKWLKALASYIGSCREEVIIAQAKAQYRRAKNKRLLSYKCVRSERKKLDALLGD